MIRRSTAALLAATLLFAACDDDDPTEPNGIEVAGSYDLTALTFDPQGTLAEVDLLARIGDSAPRLVLGGNGVAQLVFVDPQTGLFTTVTGTYTTPAGNVRVDFGTDVAAESILLPEEMTFTYDEVAGTLTIDSAATAGVDRAQLLILVPEWQQEQLLDPVPGVLFVEFTLGA